MHNEHRNPNDKTRLGLAAGLAATLTALCVGPSSAAGAEDRIFQSADAIEFFGPDPDPDDLSFTGAAWLVRSADRVEGRLMTKVDEAGTAYTVWVVIFNNPSACIPGQTGELDFGCNGADLTDPNVDAAVYYGTGAISALSPPGGVVNVDLTITDEGLPDGIFSLDEAINSPVPPGTFPADGLAEGNGLCAEIHLVVDHHPLPSNKMGEDSWVEDLTTTDFPVPPAASPYLGATNVRAAAFPVPDPAACP